MNYQKRCFKSTQKRHQSDKTEVQLQKHFKAFRWFNLLPIKCPMSKNKWMQEGIVLPTPQVINGHTVGNRPTKPAGVSCPSSRQQLSSLLLTHSLFLLLSPEPLKHQPLSDWCIISPVRFQIQQYIISILKALNLKIIGIKLVLICNWRTTVSFCSSSRSILLSWVRETC